MKYGTYVFTRPFGNFSIPVPFQNTILRDYFRSISLPYCLPEVEHKFDNCYMSLFTLMEKMEKNSTIYMVSLEMLPSNKKFNEISKIALSKEISFFGVLDKRKLKTIPDYLNYIKIRRFNGDNNE